MLKKMCYTTTLIVISLLTLLSHVDSFALAAGFGITASQTTAKVGDVIEVTIRGNQVSDLFAYELLLTYDNQLLELSGSPQTSLDGKLIVHESNTKNSLQVGFTKLDNAMISSNGLSLCTVKFRVKSIGNSAVRLDWVKQYDNKLALKHETVMQQVMFTAPPVVVNVKPVPSENQATVDLSDSTIPLGLLQTDILTIRVPAVKGVQTYSIDLPDDIFSADNIGKILTIETEYATLYLPLNKLVEAGLDKGPYRLTITNVDPAGLPSAMRSSVQGRPVLGVSMTASGRAISQIHSTERMRIVIPYPLTSADQDVGEWLSVRKVTGSSSDAVYNGRYQAETNAMIIDTAHFGLFAVISSNPSFVDLGKTIWAKQAIEALAAKGITTGTHANRFSPQANITRADFVTLLVRTLDLTTAVPGNFSDIPASAYYYTPVGIAKALNIATGIGNNRFSPASFISREDMICMAEKALRIKGIITDRADLNSLDAFSDSSQVSGYAKTSMASLISYGIIQGSQNRLIPKASTTRAAAAVILYRLYNLME